ncbi:hypothetical protein [Syntrophomonas zehnderi]|uniref:hypothetical protein n=1 Tax=Syntrophomonas zehnderi TaxID=404335 RepID=UPI000626418D
MACCLAACFAFFAACFWVALVILAPAFRALPPAVAALSKLVFARSVVWMREATEKGHKAVGPLAGVVGFQ